MEYGPPPLFNQGVSARARLALFTLLAAALIVIDARVNALDVVRRGVAFLLYPAQWALTLPGRSLHALGEHLVSVASLQDENASLRLAQAQLAQRARQADQLEVEVAQLRALAQMQERLGVPARTVNALFTLHDPYSRKIAIDTGGAGGLRPGSPVLDEFGVVGQVTRVFASDAEVTLVTDKDLSLPVQVVRNGLHAVAFGGGDAGGMELRFLPANADVVRGDAVVTSGLDGLYPPGLPVGQVERVEHDVKDQFARIVVRPVAGLARGRTLLVLLTELPALARRPEEERRRGPETTDRPARRPGVRG